MAPFFRLLVLFLFFTSNCFAETKHFLLREGNIVVLAPPGVNRDYYLLEFGFVVQKKIKAWDYNYNAYVNGALFEDWKDRVDNLHAGALGFKGGVLLPVPALPLFVKFGGGFAKSVLHKNPLFGKTEQTVKRKDMFLLELGALYTIEKYFLGLTYQKSNVRYFGRTTFLTVGVNY